MRRRLAELCSHVLAARGKSRRLRFYRASVVSPRWVRGVKRTSEFSAAGATHGTQGSGFDN